jgi:hypothetical protein
VLKVRERILSSQPDQTVIGARKPEDKVNNKLEPRNGLFFNAKIPAK